jgi:hypothetical protein
MKNYWFLAFQTREAVVFCIKVNTKLKKEQAEVTFEQAALGPME